MIRPLLALATTALLLAACTGQQAGSPTSAIGRAEPAPAADGKAAVGAPVSQNGGIATSALPLPLGLDPERSVILTANLSLRAADPWAIADRAQAVATGLGGDVVGLQESGAGDARSATLTLRVPSARFNDALRGLKALDAEVLSSSVDGKDVTDQFVDLQARLSAKQAEEQRYLALLARADKIEDVLKVDQALASVRTQIEQLTGQINGIKSRTQFSTITVGIASAAPAPEPAGGWDPARTAARATAALGVVFHAIADLAIYGIVFGWIPLLLVGLAFALTRFRRVSLPAA